MSVQYSPAESPENLPVPRAERPKRTERRFIVNQPAQIAVPDGSGQVWQARIRDISSRGMHCILDRPLAAPCVRILWRNFEIPAAVRYRRQSGAEYHLGVELSPSWDSLVSDMLAHQGEELQSANLALRQTQAALRRSNDELAAALDLAQEASRAKSRFLAAVSHELRTPLNGIIGFSQLLHDGALGTLTEDQVDSLSDVLKCSNDLLTLINRVLDLAKIEAGKMEFRYERVWLREVATGAIDSLKALAAAKCTTVDLLVDEGMGAVMADPSRLRQVIFNYLSNALKFTAEGGQILVDVSAEPGGGYRITVEDDGIGIRESDLPRLFTDFGQLGSGDKAHAGTGLGLAITKRIVEAQGGSVGVESVFGEGSRFWAVLPEYVESQAGEP